MCWSWPIRQLHVSNLTIFGLTFIELHLFWTYICHTSLTSDFHMSNFIYFRSTVVELRVLLTYVCQTSLVWHLHLSNFIYCMRYALHRRTPQARTRHWGRRRGRQLCVEREMADGGKNDSLLFQKSLEISWSESCVIVCWKLCLRRWWFSRWCHCGRSVNNWRLLLNLIWQILNTTKQGHSKSEANRW